MQTAMFLPLQNLLCLDRLTPQLFSFLYLSCIILNVAITLSLLMVDPIYLPLHALSSLASSFWKLQWIEDIQFLLAHFLKPTILIFLSMYFYLRGQL